MYALPQDTGPMVLYYRKDILAKYAMAVPSTWAEYQSDAKRMHQLDSSLHITSFSSSANDADDLLGLMWQAGARPFQYSGDNIAIKLVDDKAKPVVDYWQQMITDGLVDTSVQQLTPAWFKDIDSGKIATVIGASWASGLISANAPHASGKWAVAPLPQWNVADPSGANFGGSGNAVMQKSAHPAEAAEFAAWMATSNDAQGALLDLGSVPPSTSALKLPAIHAPSTYFGGQRIFESFKAASEMVDTGFEWAPNMTVVFNGMSDALTKAIGSKQTLADALTGAQRVVTDDLKAHGISVTTG